MSRPFDTEGSADSPALPQYDDADLAGLGTSELWHLLIRNEDRVPRNLIDECARRGDEILDLAADVLEKDYCWNENRTAGEAWLPVHATMILGLIPNERAASLLAGYMRRMADDADLPDWVANCWPAFFRNKPDEQIEIIKSLGEDASLEWFMRMEAFDSALAMAEQGGPELLGTTLAWTARFAFDDEEDELLRDMLAEILLDFARPEHRAQLEQMADEGVFDVAPGEIERRYACSEEERQWTRNQDPWSFYAPEKFEERQRGEPEAGWAELEDDVFSEDRNLEDVDIFADEDDAGDDQVFDEEDDFEPVETYVKPAPKVGRNDPCPCGSGKKYKKCCMNANKTS